jgi:hypothetical protein
MALNETNDATTRANKFYIAPIIKQTAAAAMLARAHVLRVFKIFIYYDAN